MALVGLHASPLNGFSYRHFHKGLDVSVSRSSPPMAALEDSLLRFPEPAARVALVGKVTIKANPIRVLQGMTLTRAEAIPQATQSSPEVTMPPMAEKTDPSRGEEVEKAYAQASTAEALVGWVNSITGGSKNSGSGGSNNNHAGVGNNNKNSNDGNQSGLPDYQPKVAWHNPKLGDHSNVTRSLVDASDENEGISRVISAYSTPGNILALRGARVSFSTGLPPVVTDKDGFFSLAGLSPDTSLLLKATHKDHWDSLALSLGGKTSEPITMYKDSMLKALWGEVGSKLEVKEKDFLSHGVIWGQVSQNGQPLSRAKVDLADGTAAGPIYFNDLMLPDLNMTSTGANGWFVYIAVRPGLNVVRASWDGKLLPSKIVPVGRHQVSPVHLAPTQKALTRLLSFDAFSKNPVATEVRFSGSDKSARTNFLGELTTNIGKGFEPVYIENDATDDFLPTRVVESRHKNKILIPTVRRDWIDSLKINREPETGMVIGFVKDKAYDVFTDSDGRGDMIFFSENGEIMSTPTSNGGFVLYNIPVGIHVVSIVSQGSTKMDHYAVAIDGLYTSIIYK